MLRVKYEQGRPGLGSPRGHAWSGSQGAESVTRTANAVGGELPAPAPLTGDLRSQHVLAETHSLRSLRSVLLSKQSLPRKSPTPGVTGAGRPTASPPLPAIRDKEQSVMANVISLMAAGFGITFSVTCFSLLTECCGLTEVTGVTGMPVTLLFKRTDGICHSGPII